MSDGRLERLTVQYAEAMQQLGEANARADQAEQEVNRLSKVVAEVRAALSEVAVYEGILEVSPTSMAVAELVRDHEELEARIDAAMHRLSASPTFESTAAGPVFKEIARLLQGGSRVPDTLEGLDDA